MTHTIVIYQLSLQTQWSCLTPLPSTSEVCKHNNDHVIHTIAIYQQDLQTQQWSCLTLLPSTSEVCKHNNDHVTHTIAIYQQDLQTQQWSCLTPLPSTSEVCKHNDHVSHRCHLPAKSTNTMIMSHTIVIYQLCLQTQQWSCDSHHCHLPAKSANTAMIMSHTTLPSTSEANTLYAMSLIALWKFSCGEFTGEIYLLFRVQMWVTYLP